MPIIKTKTTYLEMRAPSSEPPVPPRPDLVIEPVGHPSVSFYRQLYRSVGEPWHWVDRLIMPDQKLRKIIQHDRNDIYRLAVAGQIAGFAELDRRNEHEIELVYFGLCPPFLGQGLGSYFLAWTIHKAWSFQPRRLWLHTCDLDHPAALPTYRKAGFQIYDQQIVEQSIPAGKGSPVCPTMKTDHMRRPDGTHDTKEAD